ncbi:hypothetical protein F4777DRAFT_576711 [Nemania sp. FL0916]|nr:hypothetical protein F4777DRAFT_576711 [Nemania sp. FL0916]
MINYDFLYIFSLCPAIYKLCKSYQNSGDASILALAASWLVAQAAILVRALLSLLVAEAPILILMILTVLRLLAAEAVDLVLTESLAPTIEGEPRVDSKACNDPKYNPHTEWERRKYLFQPIPVPGLPYDFYCPVCHRYKKVEHFARKGPLTNESILGVACYQCSTTQYRRAHGQDRDRICKYCARIIPARHFVDEEGNGWVICDFCRGDGEPRLEMGECQYYKKTFEVED